MQTMIVSLMLYYRYVQNADPSVWEGKMVTKPVIQTLHLKLHLQ